MSTIQINVKSLVKNYLFSRLLRYMSLKQRTISMKVLFEARFGYCLLVWMFYGRILNRKTYQLHERSLVIIYRDSTSSFHKLLQKYHSFTINHRKIRTLVLKVKENLCDEIMNRIFSSRTLKYNLQTQTNFFRNSINSSKYGLNSFRFFASKAWQI